MIWVSVVLAAIAWGAGAFGSPYPWAYVPLLATNAALGLAGLWVGRRNFDVSPLLIVGLICVALSTAAQLIPLSRSVLAALSPHAARIVAEQDLQFALDDSMIHSLSIDPVRTELGLAFYGSFCLLLLGTARALTRETAKRLVAGLVILGCALATVGIIQRATFGGRIYGFWDLVQGGAPFGPFVNKNHFAGWMVMGLPIAFGYLLGLLSHRGQVQRRSVRDFILWLSGQQASRVVLIAFAMLIMVLSLLLTMSRSGIMAFAAAIAVATAVTVRRQRNSSQRTLTAGYVILIVICAVSWTGLDQILSRFAQVDPTSINERPAIWADTIRIIKDFWLAGTGLNTYGISTLHYQTAVPGQHLREAHNDYLQLAAEGGLVVGIPIALTIVAFVLEVRRRFREDTGSAWWIRMGAVTGLIGIALQSTVEFSLQMPGNATMFAVIAGLAIHDSRRM